MNKCRGCGALLQSEEKEKAGYIPKKMIGSPLCERCFRLIHYNDLKMVSFLETDVLKQINLKKTFAFFLVDLLNVNEEVIKTFHKVKIPKALIISKIDYIPKYIKKEKIKNWLQDEYLIKDDILFLSASKNVNSSSIISTMEKNRVKEAYLLGYTNAGKSTLLNHLKEENSITTSAVPNTTAGYISIPILEKYTLVDTPGFQYKYPIYETMSTSFLKKMIPKSILRPMTYQLKQGTSIIIEGFIRVENVGNKCNLTLYMSNLLEIKKVYENNELLRTKKRVQKKIRKSEDLVLKGLGFLSIKSNCTLNIYLDNIDWIEVRTSFFER